VISHPPVIIFYLPIATIGGYFRFVVCLFIPQFAKQALGSMRAANENKVTAKIM
jgi:hypothetical protein